MTATQPIELTYTEAPGFLAIYRRLLFGRRAKYTSGADLPNFQAQWLGAQAEETRVKAYCEACAIDYDGHYPILYPHILTSAIHLDMMSKPAFPLSPMGAVHARNHIIQHHPIPVDARLDIRCVLTTTRVLKQGVEFEVSTVLELSGKRVWESISAYLVRGKKYGDPVDASPRAELPILENDEEAQRWDVPIDMGWRYAKITGDFNPIHVSRILARFMGFDRDLIHGMWSAARCAVAVAAPSTDGSVQLDLIFKGPVYMQSTSKLKTDTIDGAVLFDLYCNENPRPVIRGQVRAISPDVLLVTDNP